MKNRVYNKVMSILLLVSSSSLMAKTVTGSFFSVRPVADNLMSQKLMLDSQHHTGRVNKQKNAQFITFVSQSRQSDDLGRYFFQGKDLLIVKEEAPGGNSLNEMKQDILARDFNIVTANDDFESELKIAPRQTVYGGSFSLRGYFGKTQQWSYAVEVPFLHVRNDLNFVETISETYTKQAGNIFGTEPIVGSIEEAFKQKGMKYGKIDGVQKKTGFGNVVLKVGYEPCAFCTSPDTYMNTYVGVILPTDNKPKGEYMFEPMLGNNRHAGIMWGTQFESLMRSGKDYNFWARWNIESRYLMQNTQVRSFDLFGNGVWSRYLPMFESEAARAVGARDFGINLLTRDAKVTPGYQGMVDVAFCGAGSKWHGTLGFTTFARQSEKVKLADTWLLEPYIASYTGATETNRFRQMGREYADLDNDGDVAIKESDIDLQSASHQGGVSQLVYMTLGGYQAGDKSRMYEVGASYEYSCFNTAMNRWGVWATLQYSF